MDSDGVGRCEEGEGPWAGGAISTSPPDPKPSNAAAAAARGPLSPFPPPPPLVPSDREVAALNFTCRSRIQVSTSLNAAPSLSAHIWMMACGGEGISESRTRREVMDCFVRVGYTIGGRQLVWGKELGEGMTYELCRFCYFHSSPPYLYPSPLLHLPHPRPSHSHA